MKNSLVILGGIFIALSFGWFIVAFISPTAAAILCLFSPVFFIIGLILLIIGLVVGELPQQPVYVYPQAPMTPAPGTYYGLNTCPKCKNPLSWESAKQRWYCQYCKKHV